MLKPDRKHLFVCIIVLTCCLWIVACAEESPDETENPVVVAETIAGDSVKAIEPTLPDFSNIDPDNYPGLGDREIGHLLWFFKVAEQPIEDFSLIPSKNINGIPYTGSYQLGMSSYRYTIAFMTYFLALEQFHKLSACPEIIKPRFDRLIKKMISRPVWKYWAVTSQGVPPLEPNFDMPYEVEHDPVRIRNIMYSGHLGHMIALYEKLYADLKWSKDGAIVFSWSEDEKYIYSNHSLQRVMYDQMINLPDHCIECEPNACFPECNQHPILSFMLYDQTHGTEFYQKTKEPLMDWFLRTEMFSPVDHEVAGIYLVKQQTTLKQNGLDFGNFLNLFTIPASMMGFAYIHSSAADGWTGTFMNSWQPEFMARHYPYQKANRIIDIDDETARCRKDGIVDQISTAFFSMLVSEMGDAGLRDRLLNWTEKQYQPVWEEDGTFHYTSNVDISINVMPGFSKTSSSLTGKLVAIARANSQNGIWKMHNTAFDGTDPLTPRVTGTDDFPKMIFRRAIYDREKEALIITTSPGVAAEGMGGFTIDRLDPERTYLLQVDKETIENYSGTTMVRIDVDMEEKHDIILIAE